MKVQYPTLAQYDALLNQRKYLTGYYREKTDKQMKEAVINLKPDQKLIDQLKKILPKMLIKSPITWMTI